MGTVVNLSDFRKKKEPQQDELGISWKKVENPEPNPIIEEDIRVFEAEMKKNKETKERMQKDRLKANKGVLKSYRIKT